MGPTHTEVRDYRDRAKQFWNQAAKRRPSCPARSACHFVSRREHVKVPPKPTTAFRPAPPEHSPNTVRPVFPGAALAERTVCCCWSRTDRCSSRPARVGCYLDRRCPQQSLRSSRKTPSSNASSSFFWKVVVLQDGLLLLSLFYLPSCWRRS